MAGDERTAVNTATVDLSPALIPLDGSDLADHAIPHTLAVVDPGTIVISLTVVPALVARQRCRTPCAPQPGPGHGGPQPGSTGN
jgi:hypothetical protein